MQRNAFTLIELLIVMSIIVLLMSILLPCLMTAKEKAFELFAMEVEVDEEGKVLLQIKKPTDRESYEDIYLIEINPPGRCRVSLKKPYPSRMKLIRKDGQDYIKWRPKWDDMGIHRITVLFEGEETSEQEIAVYVFNKERLEAERKNESDADER